MTISRPMLAASAVREQELIDHMPTQVLASPKLDGIRVLLHPELGPVTRRFKPLPIVTGKQSADNDS